MFPCGLTRLLVTRGCGPAQDQTSAWRGTEGLRVLVTSVSRETRLRESTSVLPIVIERRAVGGGDRHGDLPDPATGQSRMGLMWPSSRIKAKMGERILDSGGLETLLLVCIGARWM
jgi:hypothetical protein